MPCSAAARGTRSGALPAFNDVTDNTPCARRIVSTANGVNYASHSLCLFHLTMKLGTKDIAPPYVDAA